MRRINNIIVHAMALLLALPAVSQREILLKRTIKFQCNDQSYFIERCDYNLLVPATRPGKQEIIEYKYSGVLPNNVLKSPTNEYFLQWKKASVAQLHNGGIEVSIKLKLKTYDLKTAKKNPVIDKNDLDTSVYLKDEENFRIHAKNIQAAAVTFTQTNREAIVQAVFNYVVSHLDYHIFYYQDRGAKKALKEGEGDCTEYSELMVTLCRAKGIPARIVMGVIPRSNGSIGYHNWVEVFFPDYGWVQFDPTWADGPLSTTTFYSMKNTYVQLSNKRFIEQYYFPCFSKVPLAYRFKDTCIELTRDIGKCFAQMQRAYNKGETDKAYSLLDTLLAFEPANVVYLRFKATAAARLGKFDQALEYANLAISNSEKAADKYQSLYVLSNIYALKEDGENALKYLKDALAEGFKFYAHLFSDSDYNKVMSYKPFSDFIQELKNTSQKKE